MRENKKSECHDVVDDSIFYVLIVGRNLNWLAIFGLAIRFIWQNIKVVFMSYLIWYYYDFIFRIWMDVKYK